MNTDEERGFFEWKIWTGVKTWECVHANKNDEPNKRRPWSDLSSESWQRRVMLYDVRLLLRLIFMAFVVTLSGASCNPTLSDSVMVWFPDIADRFYRLSARSWSTMATDPRRQSTEFSCSYQWDPWNCTSMMKMANNENTTKVFSPIEKIEICRWSLYRSRREKKDS